MKIGIIIRKDDFKLSPLLSRKHPETCLRLFHHTAKVLSRALAANWCSSTAERLSAGSESWTGSGVGKAPGAGPCCCMERSRRNPSDSRDLFDLLRNLLNPHPSKPVPCGFTRQCYTSPEVFCSILHGAHPFWRDTVLIHPSKEHSLPTKTWHADVFLSWECSILKKTKKKREQIIEVFLRGGETEKAVLFLQKYVYKCSFSPSSAEAQRKLKHGAGLLFLISAASPMHYDLLFGFATSMFYDV